MPHNSIWVEQLKQNIWTLLTDDVIVALPTYATTTTTNTNLQKMLQCEGAYGVFCSGGGRIWSYATE